MNSRTVWFGNRHFHATAYEYNQAGHRWTYPHRDLLRWATIREVGSSARAGLGFIARRDTARAAAHNINRQTVSENYGYSAQRLQLTSERDKRGNHADEPVYSYA